MSVELLRKVKWHLRRLPCTGKNIYAFFSDAKRKGYPKLEPVVWYIRKTGGKKKKEDCGRELRELVKREK